MADPTNEEPNALPWYASGVQFNAVLAAAAQLISIILRIVSRYHPIDFTDQDVQLLLADITQGAAIVFGVIAIVKRQNSKIQPLTLTKAAAETKAAEIDAVAETKL